MVQVDWKSAGLRTSWVVEGPGPSDCLAVVERCGRCVVQDSISLHLFESLLHSSTPHGF